MNRIFIFTFSFFFIIGISMAQTNLLSNQKQKEDSVSYVEKSTSHRNFQVELPNQENNLIKTSWSGIGSWFWTPFEFKPDGYKKFIDLHKKFSGYDLLTTTIRYPVEVTQPAVHDRIKLAAEYARAHHMGIVMDLDVRLARQSFMEKYPEEMQEIIRLREIPLQPEGEVYLSVEPIEMIDHYTPVHFGVKPYISLSSRLVRAYSYVSGSYGIDPETIQDITDRCKQVQTDDKGMQLTISCKSSDEGHTVCFMVAFKLFTPDVFAPHLTEFEHNTLEQYADVPLAGACKDEWGFPGRFNPRLDDIYYSSAMADSYSKLHPAHDLVRDMLLMYKQEKGLESERIATINRFMEMYWKRNAAVENAYYQSIKDVFGYQAISATHPTWFPNPATKEEVFKNGLDWWACKRDLAQTDESTPFCVRTALSKKWNSPLSLNMYYAPVIESYYEELWGNVLGGSRINFHPIFPIPSEAPEDHRVISLLDYKLQAADCRVRLLNYLATSPIDCPVAVIFGHPSALNWAGPGFADVGLSVTNPLWEKGYYADLIPSSEILAGNLKIGTDGSLLYGKQRYSAAVLYNPQYERSEVADFFRKAAIGGKTALFRIGDWTVDFDGKPFDIKSLPKEMKSGSVDSVVNEVIFHVTAAGIAPQTLSTFHKGIFPGSMMPNQRGQSRLIDGTVILASGEKDVMGDTIQKSILVDGHEATFDFIGVAGIKLNTQGKVTALAGGGLKKFVCGNIKIELDTRIDIALWHDQNGNWQGVLQGYDGSVPEVLERLTKNWTRLKFPEQMVKN